MDEEPELEDGSAEYIAFTDKLRGCGYAIAFIFIAALCAYALITIKQDFLP